MTRILSRIRAFFHRNCEPRFDKKRSPRNLEWLNAVQEEALSAVFNSPSPSDHPHQEGQKSGAAAPVSGVLLIDGEEYELVGPRRSK
jgi:hypothetical protein